MVTCCVKHVNYTTHTWNIEWFEWRVWLKCSRNAHNTRLSNLVTCCVKYENKTTHQKYQVMWVKCLIEVLSKYSQHQNIQFGYLLCETCELNNTLEILSDVSEVFDWSTLEILSAPESPIWLPVVWNMNKKIHTKNIKWFEWSVWLKCSWNALSTRISNVVICCVKRE